MSNEPLALFNLDLDRPPVRSRIGPYDEKILCEECDNRLGILDGHAAKTLLQARPRRTIIDDVFCYRNADPLLICKFAWSVAWRASISNHPLFKKVKLRKFDNLLREHLQSSDAWPLDGTVLISEFDKNVPTLGPEIRVIQNTRFLLIYANRFFFTLKVDVKPMPAELADFCLTSGKQVVSIRYDWHESGHRERIYKGLNLQSRPGFWKLKSKTISLGTLRFSHKRWGNKIES